MSGSLTGKVALVAGATRGGGRGIAVALGEAGATVYATGRTTREQRSEIDRPETIEETAELVDARGRGGHRRRRSTISTPRRWPRWSSASTPSRARLDVLVNDIWGAEHLFEWNTTVWEHDLDNGLRLLRLAIDTHLITSHHALPLLHARAGRARRRGHRRDGGLQRRRTTGYSIFYDLAKTSVIRHGVGARRTSWATDGATAVALTPGWMRSEAMLEHLRRQRGELARRDRSARRTSRSPRRPLVRRPGGRRAGRPTPTSHAGTGNRCPAASSPRSTASRTSTARQPDCWRYMVEVVERAGRVCRRRRLPLTSGAPTGARSRPAPGRPWTPACRPPCPSR